MNTVIDTTDIPDELTPLFEQASDNLGLLVEELFGGRGIDVAQVTFDGKPAVTIGLAGEDKLHAPLFLLLTDELLDRISNDSGEKPEVRDDV